jgi:hypothetical protein
MTEFDPDEHITERLEHRSLYNATQYTEVDRKCPNPNCAMGWHGMARGECKGSWAYQYGGEPLPEKDEPNPKRWPIFPKLLRRIEFGDYSEDE